jgi:imidazolonepropionase-like amidohydrolase
MGAMKRTNLGYATALALLVAASLAHPQATDTARLQPTAAASTHALVGARLVSIAGAPGIENATILMRAGKIEAIGPSGKVTIPRGVPTTNLSGKFVVPGLISAHAHVSDVDGLRPRAYTAANTARQLGVFARYGITTVWSLSGEQAPAFQARDEQATPALNRARIFAAGDAITARTPDEARQAVARVAAMKPDIIKIRVDDNLGTATKMAPEIYRAVIDEAHARGLRVAVHLFYLDDAKDVLRAGADVIAHSVRDRDVDEEFLALMKSRQAAYVPTLTRELSTFVYESTPAFFDDPFFLKEADPAVVAQLRDPARQAAMRASTSAQRYKAGLEVAKRNLKRVSDAGILVAMGTDAGPFPERFEGYFEHVEMAMMVESGLTPAQVLRASTMDAARAMRVEGVGTLAPGAWADLLVLNQDPLKDIRNTRQIASVWIAGNAIAR